MNAWLANLQAVSESLPVKQAIFSSLATHLPPHAILASNTSSISLSTLAASAVSQSGENRASQVVGFHFCASERVRFPTCCLFRTGHRPGPRLINQTHSPVVNPVPVMKLVELIPALQTDPTVLATAREFAERMGKTVTQSADTPGTPTVVCFSFESNMPSDAP